MVAKSDVFLGLTAEWWTAVGTMLVALFTFVLAAVTVVLVVLGRQQLISIRDESKQQRTIAICEKWDTDPVIDQCLRRLAEGWKTNDIFNNPRTFRIDAVSILNFLETLCTGIELGIYDEKLVKEFHKDTISDQIVDYIQNGLIEKMDLEIESYESLQRIHQKWQALV